MRTCATRIGRDIWEGLLNAWRGIVDFFMQPPVPAVLVAVSIVLAIFH